jgi:hypothetical protein
MNHTGTPHKLRGAAYRARLHPASVPCRLHEAALQHKDNMDTNQSKFYHFSQNNSGGSFTFSEGISVHVIIEALSTEHAESRAEEIGLYFDGVSEGRDCGCCGDRWNRLYSEGHDSPCLYGEPVGTGDNWARRWSNGKPYAYVHYLDGRIESHT